MDVDGRRRRRIRRVASLAPQLASDVLAAALAGAVPATAEP
jgi:hypothetical protein